MWAGVGAGRGLVCRKVKQEVTSCNKMFSLIFQVIPAPLSTYVMNHSDLHAGKVNGLCAISLRLRPTNLTENVFVIRSCVKVRFRENKNISGYPGNAKIKKHSHPETPKCMKCQSLYFRTK